MTTNEKSAGWVPQACTLPTVEQPLRLAEFDDLFTTALRRQQRMAPTRLRWELDPAAEDRVRDLTARESGCCSFFAFTFSPPDFSPPDFSPPDFSPPDFSPSDFSPSEKALRLDVEVRATQIAVLDALAARAAAGIAV